MDADALAATTEFCALCQHEEGAHAPPGSPEGRPCAEDGCRCPGYQPVAETCEACGHPTGEHRTSGCGVWTPSITHPKATRCQCRWQPGSPAQEDGEAYACPGCGATDEWVADYDQAVHQGVYLLADGKGGYDCVDYKGDEDSYDDGTSENWVYRCRSCDLHLPGDALDRSEIIAHVRLALAALLEGRWYTAEQELRAALAAPVSLLVSPAASPASPLEGGTMDEGTQSAPADDRVQTETEHTETETDTERVDAPAPEPASGEEDGS